MAMSDCMSDQLFANSLISSHKTLFVLDRNAYFSKSSKQPIEYDVIVRSKTPGIIPAAPITKTLWTCNVECMMEYMRIVYDIYPVRKLIRIITGNHSLNSWTQKEQNLQHLMIALAHLGPPTNRNKSEDEYSVMHGLARSVEVMCEPSEAQTTQADNNEVVNNHGRIICLTSFKRYGAAKVAAGHQPKKVFAEGRHSFVISTYKKWPLEGNMSLSISECETYS